MVDPITIGKKATKFGYKRYGIPGAVIVGGGAVAGYLVVKRKLESPRREVGETEEVIEVEIDEAEGDEPGEADAD